MSLGNYDAEFGKAMAGVVTVQTKSGSNDFHGYADWFRRTDALAARDPSRNTRRIRSRANLSLRLAGSSSPEASAVRSSRTSCSFSPTTRLHARRPALPTRKRFQLLSFRAAAPLGCAISVTTRPSLPITARPISTIP